MKKLKKHLVALPFIAALLMLSFEPAPGPYWFTIQMALVAIAIVLLIVTAVISHKIDYEEKND